MSNYKELLDNLSLQTGQFYRLQVINTHDQVVQTIDNTKQIIVKDCYSLNGVYRSLDDLKDIANNRHDYAIGDGKIYSDATIGLVIGHYNYY